MCVSVQSSFQLLYRGSRDGFSSSSFHLHCDGLGPTLTIVRVKSAGRDYVFGGFTRESWSQGGGAMVPQGHWIASTEAWTFSLINAYKRSIKFKIKNGSEKFAQYCDTKHAAMVRETQGANNNK